MGSCVLLPLLIVSALVDGLTADAAHAVPRERVAVIGAGIGAATTVHFSGLHCDVYERSDEVGGRAHEVRLQGGKLVEAGASMVYSGNHYVRGLAKLMNLTEADHAGEEDGLTIWDGRSIRFQTTADSWKTLAAMLLRYGLSPALWGHTCAATFRKFETVYTLQELDHAFRRPEDLLTAMGVFQETQHTLEAFFSRSPAGWVPGARAFLSEMLGAINACNYNQGPGMNALVGLVSSLPAFSGSVFALQEGNSRLPARLIRAAAPRARLLLNTDVVGVHRRGDGRFDLRTAGGSVITYDAVVLAAPLESARIAFTGVTLPPIPARAYQQTITTFVEGLLDPAYFGQESLQGAVLVSDDSTDDFSSISPVSTAPAGRIVYKVFSQLPLSDAKIAALFGPGAHTLHTFTWDAYPVFEPPEEFAPFELAPGLIYGSAWENAASAMEMSAIAGRNSALLVQEHLIARSQRRKRQAGGVPGLHA